MATATATAAIVALLLGLSGWRGAARDILPPGPVDAAVGKNVTLATLLQNPEYSFIIWNFNDGREQTHVATAGRAGIRVNEPYAGRASVDATSGALRLSALTTDDSGDFSVSVVSADGETEIAEIQLRVLEPVSGVLVSADAAEAVEHNSTLVLTCAANGSFLRFTWLNETRPVVASDSERLSVEESEASSRLTIAGVLRTDLARPIFCSAANQLETEKSAPFTLPVHYGPDEVTVTASDPSRFVRADSDFNLTCATRSSPAAAFTWYQNETLMDSAGPVLPLEAVRRRPLWREMSRYTCRAANAETERVVASPAVSFAVVDGPEAATVNGESAVELRDAVTLRCTAASVPPANFTWKFNGTLTDVKTPTYAIAEAVYKNTGAYTCQARNVVTGKNVSSTHNLSVKEEGALDEGLSDGAIAGIIIGILAALGVAIGVVVYCRQKVPVESPY
ncbi:carcinoembryonic antigen-related cell adhesion molecule 5 isoform X3 [Phycodurus eques]|uniref:carcinoembryonic antigen-related cell adhesion molecule 5 isoform X3 n=1 Tax=Phycodurus eques TaxID=693459 RepID=UPI002ACE58B7|nr:carcinoembryonic antigen-related cell adhesion molecule 5 isoform X3 [Phycodurus eques]